MDGGEEASRWDISREQHSQLISSPASSRRASFKPYSSFSDIIMLQSEGLGAEGSTGKPWADPGGSKYQEWSEQRVASSQAAGGFRV